MKYLLGVLLCIAALVVVARADPLSPNSFTGEFARALARAMPSASVTVTGDMEVDVKAATGRHWTVVLRNTYQDYKRDPGLFDEIVKAYAARLSAPRPNDVAKVDRSRIVPVIKHQKWLHNLHSALKARGLQQEHLSEPFISELVIVYAEDDPDKMRYLTTAEGGGMSREELKALAIENLKRIVPSVQLRVHDNIMHMTANGDYDSSLLLIDEIWSGGKVRVDGDIVVAVPARDVLLVTGSRNRGGMRKMRELAAKVVAEGPFELTATLFAYRNGRFTKFGR